MTSLHTLSDTTRIRKSRKRVGRGIGSGLGKTCGRGVKGEGARSGHKHRWGYEGGQFRTFAKMPIRGFSNARFRKTYDVINLKQIDAVFNDGEEVSAETLVERGFLSGVTYGIKILGDGEITKKISFQVAALSKSAHEKLQKANIPFKLV